jgi:hypothetical protein
MQTWITLPKLHRLAIAPCSLIVAGTGHAQEPVFTEPSDDGIAPAVGVSTGHATLGVGLFAGQSITGKQEVGAQLVVEVPFGRLFVPRATSAALTTPSAGDAAPLPRAAVRPNPRVTVKPSLARACVRAAWRAHGMGDLEMLDDMRARARTSALLPEARFRMVRDWDQSYRLAPTNDDPYRLHESNSGGRTMEGRLTWKLDRLLFVDAELSMERLRVQQMQLRSRLAGEVLRALFDWQRARLAVADPALDDAEHLEAVLREAEAAAVLDVLTGGWFSSWLGEDGRG